MNISRNLAAAIDHCDYSGLENNEIELIKDFPDFYVIDWKEESKDINSKCAITRLWDHCVEIEVIS